LPPGLVLAAAAAVGAICPALAADASAPGKLWDGGDQDFERFWLLVVDNNI